MTDHKDSQAIVAIEEVSKPGFRERLIRTAKKAARHIPFSEDVAAAYYCALDPSTPFKAKATIAAALAYFVAPADLVPDFIAVLGFTDDLAVLTAALAAVRPHVNDSHREAAARAFKDGEEA
mgnify:CR=1 FL=1